MRGKFWRLPPNMPTVLCLGAAASMLGGCDGASRVAGVPAHLVSHQLCSAVFVAGLDPAEYYREELVPKLGVAGPLIHYDIDRARREVRVSLAGLVQSRAADEGPYGCRVVHPGIGFAVAHGESELPQPVSISDPVVPGTAALSAALDRAFAEPNATPQRYTKAVVVVQHGEVVAERYAPGITAATPLHGWSMTKSVTNALLGILVREGKLDMSKPAPVAEWSSPDDPHHAITTDELLRMKSGLRCGQSLSSGWYTIFDADAQMEYDRPDEAGFAAQAALRAPPGTQWQYTNCNFVLLSRIIKNAAGGTPRAARAFIERELFAPLGFEHATLEFDSAGTPLGSIQLWASARDWAKFGLLYLHDGVAPDGQRILPEGWVDYSARRTPQSGDQGYGAGFWTQRGGSVRSFPKDSFMAWGAQGQYTIVIPSEDLVIVRLGWSQTPDDDMPGTERLTRDIIAALRADHAPVSAANLP